MANTSQDTVIMHFQKPVLVHISNPFRRRQSNTSSSSSSTSTTTSTTATVEEHSTSPITPTSPSLPRPLILPETYYTPRLPRRDSHDPTACISRHAARQSALDKLAAAGDQSAMEEEEEGAQDVSDDGSGKEVKEKRRKFSVCGGWIVGAEEGSIDTCVFGDGHVSRNAAGSEDGHTDVGR